jgi:3-hydroxyisobutyrate dehydrogenase and related beta-hydroxyacid dehydrogenases
MSTKNEIPRDVTVIGLGMMGATLARLLLQNGYRVTVWNRTPEKADALVREGAILAPDAASAVAASPVVVVCVHDYKATHEILGPKAAASALAGRLLIQLTTGSPQEARDAEAWAREHRAEYLDGAIQAAPDQMARPDTMILLSGAQSAFRRGEAVLRLFGGNLRYLGESVGLASAMDLATLSTVYGVFLGFLHGARVSEVEGIRVDDYAAILAEALPTFSEFFRHEGYVIQSGDFTVSQSPLSISVAATERLVQTGRASGIDTAFPELAADLLRRAAAAGYENEEVAAAIKVLRQSRKE